MSDVEINKAINEVNKMQMQDLKNLLALAKNTPEKMKIRGNEIFEKMSKKFAKRYTWKLVDNIAYSWKEVEAKESALVVQDLTFTLPLEQEIILKPPYEFEHRESVRGDDTQVNRTTGNFSASSRSIYAGGNTSEAGVGHFFNVPPGYRFLRAFAVLPESRWTLYAGSLGGASGAKVRSQIEIIKNGTTICRKNFVHGSVVSPFAWFANDSGTDNVAINCLISAPQDRDELVMNFYGLATTWAFANGNALATIRSKPRDIKIRLSQSL